MAPRDSRSPNGHSLPFEHGPTPLTPSPSDLDHGSAAGGEHAISPHRWSSVPPEPPDQGGPGQSGGDQAEAHQDVERPAPVDMPGPPAGPTVPPPLPQEAPALAPLPEAETGPELPPAPAESSEQDGSADDESPIAEQIVRDAPPWLVSVLFHLLLVLVLGLLIIRDQSLEPIHLKATISDSVNEEIDDEPLTPAIETPAEELIVTPEALAPVNDPFAAPPEIEIHVEGLEATSDVAAPQVGSALSGREEGMKQALVEAFGGSGESEEAVLRGLKWLARQQNKQDGSWSLRGPYADGASIENHGAATAMAMLAFQGAGHTHQRGAFAANVDAGRRYLIATQDSHGLFYPEVRYPQQLYMQAQCTIAICELYGMTGDEALRRPAEMALSYCLQAQDRGKGGWRYQPRDDSDTSVTGWMVMALMSAQMAGLEIPPETLELVDEYLDRASTGRGSRYAYTIARVPTVVMTAEGLLCRQYLGWERDDKRLISGVEYVLKRPPRWDDRNVYYWYYATQLMHHMEGEYWKTWNAVMRDLLVEKQEVEGEEAGSWHPTLPTEDRWGFQGGRLYVTCLSIYILEVYYRHLPIYSMERLRLPQ